MQGVRMYAVSSPKFPFSHARSLLAVYIRYPVSGLLQRKPLVPRTVALQFIPTGLGWIPDQARNDKIHSSRSGSARRMKAFPGFARATLLLCYVLMMCRGNDYRCDWQQKWVVTAASQPRIRYRLTRRLEADWALEKMRHPPGGHRKMQAPCHPVSCIPNNPRSGR